MTDDLIPRKAAIEATKIPNGEYDPCDRHGIIVARFEIRTKIMNIPSVPAVPLDKLCKWLENVFKDPPCMLDNMVQCKKECRGFQKVKYRDCWRYFLNKWMEEQDEADRP